VREWGSEGVGSEGVGSEGGSEGGMEGVREGMWRWRGERERREDLRERRGTL
jgi:hypothetical protein